MKKNTGVAKSSHFDAAPGKNSDAASAHTLIQRNYSTL
jgi:hypothetical protein